MLSWADINWDEPGITPDARDLIDKLLITDPHQRLGAKGAQEVKNHPFFKTVNWSTLLEEPRDHIFLPNPDDEEDTSYFVGI